MATFTLPMNSITSLSQVHNIRTQSSSKPLSTIPKSSQSHLFGLQLSYPSNSALTSPSPAKTSIIAQKKGPAPKSPPPAPKKKGGPTSNKKSGSEKKGGKKSEPVKEKKGPLLPFLPDLEVQKDIPNTGKDESALEIKRPILPFIPGLKDMSATMKVKKDEPLQVTTEVEDEVTVDELQLLE